MDMKKLDKIMKPRSIAVIGASTKAHSVGSDLMKRLREYGFKGDVYPVNPKGGVIEGYPVYTSLTEVPDGVDLAVIVIPRKAVLDAIDQCHDKGIEGICIISAGFKESGGEGAEAERLLVEKIRQYGMRLVGPNCLGVVNTHPDVRMDACFAESLPRSGGVGFVSQSGALGGGILNILRDLHLGFAQFISIGNQADVDAETALEYWENDDDVKMILLYMESIQNPANFRKLAARISKKKPIIALKAGRSAAGASAASSHTGSLAGADRAADSLLRQCGVIREMSLKDMFSTAKVFTYSPVPKGNRVAIVTNSGGPGIMATDAICEAGLQIAKLSDATKDELRSFLPAAASVKNPVDMIASAPLEHYRQTVDCILRDENVDMVIVIYLPFMGLKDHDVADAVMEVRAKYPEKPVIGAFMTTSDFFTDLADKKVNMPFFMYAEEAAQGLARLDQQRRWIERDSGTVAEFEVDRAAAEKVIKTALAENRDQLTTLESIDVLAAYGIRACRYGLATNEDEAAAIANSIGYPVVMKISSRTITHKSDVGGVVVGLKNEEHLRAEYRALIKRLEDKGILDGLEGVIVQEMVSGTRELVCGSTTDPQYGQLVMFGLGGIYIEVMKDVVFRVAPLTDTGVKEMIRSVKAYKLLEGVRGARPANIGQVEETIRRLSQLVCDYAFIRELDINPLLIQESTGDAVAVDGRIRVDVEAAKKALGC